MKFASILGLMMLALCGVVRAQCAAATHIATIPEGLAFDASGNLWQADYGNGGVWNMGTPPTKWDSSQCYDTEPFVRAYVNSPGATRLAFQGNELAVAESTANQVTLYPNVFAPSPSEYANWSITGLQRPLGVAVAAAGQVFIAENGSSDIAVYSATGTRLGAKTQDANGHSFTAPGALAINGATLYVGTNDGSVHAYSVQNFLASLNSSCIQFDGRTLCNYPNPTEVATFQDGMSSGPTGIAFDAQGSVYVCYYYSGDVVKYSAAGKKLLTLTAQVSQPEGIAVSLTTGSIYVANAGSQQITVYDASGTFLGVWGMTFPY